MVTVDLGHDTTRALAGLRMPALVLGGAVDPFFPAAALEATATAIPDAELRIFPHNGHGVPKHRAAEMQESVAAFLAGADADR